MSTIHLTNGFSDIFDSQDACLGQFVIPNHADKQSLRSIIWIHTEERKFPFGVFQQRTLVVPKRLNLEDIRVEVA